MSDNTRLNTGIGGDLIRTEDIAGSKIPTSKLVLGNKDVDDGDVSASNPLPAELTDGTNTVGVTVAGALKVEVENTTLDVDASITLEASSSFSNNQQLVSTSAVQLASHSSARGILVKASDNNTGVVYLGSGAGVTTSSGYELSAGQAVSIPLTNSNLIWLIADTLNQRVSFIAV